MIAIGVVFVLLIGEIDLSIGFVSGVGRRHRRRAAAARPGPHFPGLFAIICAVLVGAVIGPLQGSFVALLGVPSFVVTLAGLLIWQGVILQISSARRASSGSRTS